MVNNLLVLMELFGVIVCIYKLYGEKLKADIYNISLIIFVVVFIEAITRGFLPESAMPFAYAGICIFCIFEFDCRFIEAFINCVLAFMIIGVLQLLFYLPAYAVTGGIQNEILEHFIIHICSFAAVLLINRIVNLHILSLYFQKRGILIKAVFAVMVVFFAIRLYEFKGRNFIGNRDYVFVMLFIFMTFILVFQWQKARSEVERRNMELEMQKLCNDSFAELIRQIRMRQHDFKNHLNAIMSMQYTASSLEELREKQEEYRKHLEEENKFGDLLSMNGNPTMIGFLYSKFSEADKKGIRVLYRVEIGELQSETGLYRLIEVVGILFDNALEALEHTDRMEKEVHFMLTESEEQIFVHVSNVSRRYRQDEMEQFFQKGYSTKGNGRGIGLEKVKTIMEKSDGKIVVENRSIDGNNYLVFELYIRSE